MGLVYLKVGEAVKEFKQSSNCWCYISIFNCYPGSVESEARDSWKAFVGI